MITRVGRGHKFNAFQSNNQHFNYMIEGFSQSTLHKSTNTSKITRKSNCSYKLPSQLNLPIKYEKSENTKASGSEKLFSIINQIGISMSE